MYIKNDEILKIDRDSIALFKNPRFATKLNREQVIREKAEGTYTAEDMKVLKFLYEAKYATKDMLIQMVDMSANDLDNRLEWLITNGILNKFAVDNGDGETKTKNKDGYVYSYDEYKKENKIKGELVIYVLDFGGRALLSDAGFDTYNWKPSQVMSGGELLRKGLVNAYLILGLNKATKTVLEPDDFVSNKLFWLNQGIMVRADNKFALTGVSDPLKKYNFLTLMTTYGDEYNDNQDGAGFQASITNFRQLLYTGRNWVKYYLDENNFPVFLIVIEDTEFEKDGRKVQLERAAEVVAKASDYKLANGATMIMGFKQLVESGLQKAPKYTIKQQIVKNESGEAVDTDYEIKALPEIPLFQ